MYVDLGHVVILNGINLGLVEGVGNRALLFYMGVPRVYRTWESYNASKKIAIIRYIDVVTPAILFSYSQHKFHTRRIYQREWWNIHK